jgi:hypothetical protein
LRSFATNDDPACPAPITTIWLISPLASRVYSALLLR